MLLLTGEFRGLIEEPREWQGEKWTQRSIQVRDVLPNGREVNVEAALPKDFPVSQLPEKGKQIAVEVSVKAWKSKAGNVGTEVTAWRLAALPGSGVRVAAAAS